MKRRSIIRRAHGSAAKGGAVLVAEAPPLDEIPPLSAEHTAQGNAARALRGKPFTKGNRAGSQKGSSLTRVTVSPTAPEEQRRVDRRAAVLAATRVREMTVAHGGGKLSTAVRTEVVAWARAVAWSDHYYRSGDPKQGESFAEKASAHGMKAVGLAEREPKPAPAFPWLTAPAAEPDDDQADDEEHGVEQPFDVEQEPATMAETTSDEVEHEVGDTRVSLRPDQAPEQQGGQSWERAHAQRASRIEPVSTRWNPVTGRPEPIPPAAPALSMAPQPDARAVAALRARTSTKDSPPALPQGWVQAQQPDGTWRPSPPPAAAAPSEEARAEMAKLGQRWDATARKWVRA